MYFDVSIANKKTTPAGTQMNYRKQPTTASAVLFTIPKGKSGGRTTGSYSKEKDGTWYQVVLNGTGTTAYVRADVVKLLNPPADDKPVTARQSQSMIDQLVKNDRNIFYILLRSSSMIEALKKKGINTSQYEKQLKELSARHLLRQDKIKNSKLLKWQSGINSAYKKLGEIWNRFLKNAGIGEPISMTTAVVISAIVGGSLAVVVYFVFKPSYSETQADLKLSTELESALKKVDPATAEKIKTDLEKQIDQAYNRGKTDGKFSGFVSIIKPLLFMTAGFVLVDKFLLSRSNHKR